MSKVKIQGNATGTGIFTVSAPATNTDRTLTLPDTSSTLLAPDSTGSIQLDYAGSNNYLRFISSANYVGRNSSTGDIWLNAQGGQSVVLGINDTTQLKVDGNGRVTTPNQPAFSARRTAGSVSGATAQVVIFDAVDLNIGSCYSSSTGRFTAPVNGTYVFLMSIETNNSTFYGTWRKNGSTIRQFEFQMASSNTSGVMSHAIVNMAAGDYVDYYLSSGSIYGTGSYTYLSGYLIG